MRFKRASEIFRDVDPNLKVIDGGRRRRRLSARGQAEWDKLNGTKCHRCGEDAVRFRPEDRVCINCAQNLNEKELREERKHARFERWRRTHNARIDRNKKGSA